VNGKWQESVVAFGARHLAVRTHGPDSGIPVIAVHGWRDNAATFELLGPLLPALRLIAIDMPGHGLSPWRDADGEYFIWSYIEEVLAVADALDLKHFHLLGHSMGGAVSCLIAGLLPERIDSLALLDAVGPLATSPDDMPGQMLRALEQAKMPTRRHHYPSFEAAVAARAAKGLDTPAATILGQRGIDRDEKGWYWTLDPRLSRANLLSLSEAQVEVFMRRIVCPTLLIAAPAYWPDRRQWFEQRCSYLSTLQRFDLPGGHHQHLEGQVTEVAALLRDFFTF
jgi:pimeloyl-ACP methyl ester carboxylesterase